MQTANYPDASPPRGVPAASAPAPHPNGTSGSPSPTVLVVSPDRTVARRVRRALVPDPQALAVHAVAGLPAARGALHAGPVAAIVLDATGELPDFAPLAALRAEAPAVPIVALLTGEDPARHAAVRAAGALDTLPAARAGGELLRRSLHYVVAQAAAVAALEAGRRDAEALRESRERYRQMFERNQAIKLLIDPESGLIVDANPAAARFYGYPREVLTRMRITDLNTLPAGAIAGEMSRALQEERNYFHFRHRLASGQVRDVEVDTSPLEIQGRLLLYSIVHDISDRKRAETELLQERYLLHTLMNHLPDSIYFKDRASRFVRVNRAVAARFGLPDPAEAVDRADADFFAPEHARDALADEQAIMESGEPILNKVERETWPDGHETWVATSKLPLRDADGRIVGTFGISSDITERRQAEEAIRSLNAELEARVRDRTAALESLNRELAVEVAERTRAEAALHTRALQQAAIAALGQDALAGADLPDLFARATSLVAQTLDVEYCKVLELRL